jgi:O-antigen ligase
MLPLLASWACLLLVTPLLAWTRDPGAALRTVLPAAWLAAALVSALLGLLQWFGLAPSGGLISPAGIGEAYGNLRQRNHFASLMSLGLAALVWTAIPWWRPAVLAAAMLLACASASSASRTGLLQLLMLTVLAAGWSGPRRERLLVCACALASYGLATWLLPVVLQHWRGVEATDVIARVTTELGCSSRRVLWSNVLHLISQRPWTGWGAGELDYAHFATLYPGERFCDILDNAHNLPLHIAVEFGMPVAVAVSALLAIAVWKAKPWRASDAPAQLAWAVLALITAHSLLEYPLWYGPFQVAVLLSLVLLAGSVRLSAGSRAGVLFGALAGLLLLGGIWRSYDTVSQAYLPPAERRPALREDPVRAAGRPWFFNDQLRFAELAITPVSRTNAARVHELAGVMLHYSPEPAVVEKFIESALLLGRQDAARWAIARYRAAFPDRFREWFSRWQSAQQAP